jgi:hypothetical protein
MLNDTSGGRRLALVVFPALAEKPDSYLIRYYLGAPLLNLGRTEQPYPRDDFRKAPDGLPPTVATQARYHTSRSL